MRGNNYYSPKTIIWLLDNYEALRRYEHLGQFDQSMVPVRAQIPSAPFQDSAEKNADIDTAIEAAGVRFGIAEGRDEGAWRIFQSSGFL